MRYTQIASRVIASITWFRSYRFGMGGFLSPLIDDGANYAAGLSPIFDPRLSPFRLLVRCTTVTVATLARIKSGTAVRARSIHVLHLLQGYAPFFNRAARSAFHASKSSRTPGCLKNCLVASYAAEVIFIRIASGIRLVLRSGDRLVFAGISTTGIAASFRWSLLGFQPARSCAFCAFAEKVFNRDTREQFIPDRNDFRPRKIGSARDLVRYRAFRFSGDTGKIFIRNPVSSHLSTKIRKHFFTSFSTTGGGFMHILPPCMVDVKKFSHHTRKFFS